MILQMPGVLDLTRDSDYFWALLPEIVLAVGAMAILLLDVAQKGSRSEPSRPSVAWASLAVLALTALANAALLAMSATAAPAMIAVDRFRVFVNFVILISAALTLLISVGFLDRKGINRGEFHALVLFAALGMMLMAGARDLMMIFIALELMSIAIYVLVGFDRLDARSAEASLKYFLLGAFSSAFFLFGVALTWGSTGTTDIPMIGSLVQSGAVPLTPMLLAGMGLLFVGFGFKVAAVPFHMWTPDAYEGAPTPVTALMSTGVKAAAFAAFFRVFLVGFQGAYDQWVQIGALVAMVTMIGANLIAMTEGSVKRMLAYSSIAHAGYLLVAMLSIGGGQGAEAFLFYLLVYTLMTAGAFAMVIANSRDDGEERVSLEDWQGFAAEKPWMAGLFAIFLLSLAGFPLTAGFLGKLYILRAAVSSGLTSLAVVLVLTSLLSYFYYLRIVVVMYMRPARVPGEHRGARLSGPAWVAAGVTAALVVLLFFAGNLPLRWAARSAHSLWSQGTALQAPSGGVQAGPVARVP